MTKQLSRIFCLVLALMIGLVPMAYAEITMKNVGSSVHFKHSTYHAREGTTITLEVVADRSEVLTGAEFFIPEHHRKIATIDPKTGVLTTHSQGTITVYFGNVAEKIAYAKCTLKAVYNGHVWSMHKSTPAKSAVVVSPKRVYYHAGQTVGEIFVYNRDVAAGITELVIPSGTLYLGIVDKESKEGPGKNSIDHHELANAGNGFKYTFANRVRKGHFTVIRIVFPKDHAARDFTTGRYVPELYAEGHAITAKVVGSKVVLN